MAKRLSTKLQCPKIIQGRSERALWREIMEAYASNHFNKGDVPLLVDYVRSKEISDQAYATLSVEGHTIEGARGPIVNPAFKVWKESAMAKASLAVKLRISPNSRTRPEDGVQSAKKAETGKTFNPASSWRDHQTSASVN